MYIDMKKNILFLRAILSVMVVFSLIGCTNFEEDDLFTESAALRTVKNGDRLQEILVAAPQGWVVQYHVGIVSALFEGFNLFAKFESNGKVTFAGNHRFLRDGNANTYTEHSSLYEMIREEGLVLAFNTWNDVLTPFVDPVAHWAAPDILISDGAGMQGDQNWVVMSFNDNEIILRGERYGAEIRMIKADRAWATYIADTETMRNTIASEEVPSYYFTDGKDTLYLTGLRDGRYRKCDRVVNPLSFDSISCCFTPTGFRNERKDEFFGHSYQEFTLSDDKTCLVNEDGTIKVIATWDRMLATSTQIMWMDTLTMSNDLKTLYYQLDDAFKASGKNNSLSRIGIGETTNANKVTGLVIEWKVGRSKSVGGMALTRLTPSFGQVKIVSQPDNMDNKLLEKDATVLDAVRAFGAVLDDTYDMTPESYFNLSTTVFVSADGTKTFKLVK